MMEPNMRTTTILVLACINIVKCIQPNIYSSTIAPTTENTYEDNNGLTENSNSLYPFKSNTIPSQSYSKYANPSERFTTPSSFGNGQVPETSRHLPFLHKFMHPHFPHSGTPYSGSPYSGSPYSGSPYAGAPHSGSPFTGSPYSTAAPYSGSPYSGSPYSGSPYSGVPYSGSPFSGSPFSTGAPYSGSSYSGSPYSGAAPWPSTGYPYGHDNFAPSLTFPTSSTAGLDSDNTDLRLGAFGGAACDHHSRAPFYPGAYEPYRHQHLGAIFSPFENLLRYPQAILERMKYNDVKKY